MAVVVGHDATHPNVPRLPRGQTAGYTTGTPDIKWTAADWDAHPKGVRICQDSGTDHSADVLDVERGAATNLGAAAWVPRAAASFKANTRPGQRAPAVYTSASNVTPLVNELIAAGIKTGVGLWVANWDLTDAQAVADVENGRGPFPIIAVQYSSGQFYDTDIFSVGWLAAVSVAGPHVHVTAAGDTVGGIAASRQMRPWSWLALQDQLGADTGALTAGPLPAGVQWRSVNQ